MTDLIQVHADGSSSFTSGSDRRKKLLSLPTISVHEAAEVLDLGINTAYQAVKSGDLPSVRIGGKIRVLTAPLKRQLGIVDDPAPPVEKIPASFSQKETSAPPKPAPKQPDYKTMMMRTNRAGWAGMSRLSILLDRPLEDLLIEAANALLVKHGQPGCIEKAAPSEKK